MPMRVMPRPCTECSVGSPAYERHGTVIVSQQQQQLTDAQSPTSHNVAGGFQKQIPARGAFLYSATALFALLDWDACSDANRKGNTCFSFWLFKPLTLAKNTDTWENPPCFWECNHMKQERRKRDVYQTKGTDTTAAHNAPVQPNMCVPAKPSVRAKRKQQPGTLVHLPNY